MPETKDQQYRHWNGKNPHGGATTGNPTLLEEGPRETATHAKYQVANDTVSAANLQERPRPR